MTHLERKKVEMADDNYNINNNTYKDNNSNEKNLSNSDQFYLGKKNVF